LVKVEGLTEIILIKQGSPATEPYVVDVLRTLCPEVSVIKNLTVHTEATGGFIPDEIYVITRLFMRKGQGFDVAGKTIFQQYTDRQGQHGWLVYVYEGVAKPRRLCINCHVEIKSEAVYCPKCGTKQ